MSSNDQDKFNLEAVERLSALEVKEGDLRVQVERHEGILDELGDKINSLVVEVGKIRNALYFMAIAISANIPLLGKLLEQLKIFLFK